MLRFRRQQSIKNNRVHLLNPVAEPPFHNRAITTKRPIVTRRKQCKTLANKADRKQRFRAFSRQSRRFLDDLLPFVRPINLPNLWAWRVSLSTLPIRFRSVGLRRNRAANREQPSKLQRYRWLLGNIEPISPRTNYRSTVLKSENKTRLTKFTITIPITITLTCILKHIVFKLSSLKNLNQCDVSHSPYATV